MAESEGNLIRLLHDARSGDDRALAGLLPHLAAAMKRRLVFRFGDSEVMTSLIADAVQEGLLRVLKSLREVHANDDAQLISWATTIADNCAYDLIRKQLPKYTAVVFTDDVERLESPEAPHDTSSEALGVVRKLLERVMARYSDEVHELIYLRVVEGRTHLEIAATLQISASAAKRRWQRLQKRLASDLNRELEHQAPSVRQQARGWLGLDGGGSGML